MRYLLCAINAKYIHTNLAVLSLQAYCRKRYEERDSRDVDSRLLSGGIPEVLVREYTINHHVDDILQDLYSVGADVFIFSTYIWNVEYVSELAEELKKVLPHCSVWAGGPEVSYRGREFLSANPAVDLLMQGEGEEVFYRLTEYYHGNIASLPQMAGILVRKGEKDVEDHGLAPLMDMDELPFVYQDFSSYSHKILYYETSRGCPFRCSYCLSSLDKKLRFRSIEKVKNELEFFLNARVSQVKFVDRTFNCERARAREIWEYLVRHDNGVTNFHFEISADLLDDETMEIFRMMRPGLIQLEIGVQSTNPPTLEAIRRPMDLKELFLRVDQVHALGNIHQHLDLIAGLPHEDYESFARSFDQVYVHKPDQLQLGFLKVLKGTRMMEEAENHGIRYRSRPPYETLATRWLSYGDMIRLKGVEELVEIYYNSDQYTYTLAYAVPFFESPFRFYEEFSRYYRGHELHKKNHNRLEKYEILRDFLKEQGRDMPLLDQILIYDFYLREKAKGRPDWAPDLASCRKGWKDIFRTRGNLLYPHISPDRYDSRFMANHSHMERFSFDICAFVLKGVYRPGTFDCLFDYTQRNPLNREARTLSFPAERD